MIKKVECELIFIEETTDENHSPKKAERTRKVACDCLGSYSSNYYVARNRDMRISNNLRVAEHQLTSEKGQLRYVVFNGINYQIRNILNDKHRYKILDIEEYKR